MALLTRSTPAAAVRRVVAPVLAVLALVTAAPAQADPRVGGDIGVHYDRLGGATGILGDPLTPEITTPDGRGAYVVFQRGSIYWSPATGAHEVHGEVREAWGRLGWENGLLGFPTSDEQRTPGGGGAYNDFAGGRLVWSPWTGGHELHGLILRSYLDSGSEVGPLGFPTSNEITTPDRRGAYTTFEWGAVYWTPRWGAHPVYGAIRQLWAAQGWENGCLGFPVSGEYEHQGARVQQFEGGWVWFRPQDGAHAERYPADPVYAQRGLGTRC